MKKNFILSISLLTLLWGCHSRQATDEFSSLDDIKEKRLGVLMGSIQDEYTTKNFPNAEILRIDMSPDLIMSLKTNQCDAIILPRPEAKRILAKNSDLGILEDDLFGSDFGIGIGFRDCALRDQFNAFLSQIAADGSLDDMTARWIDGEGKVDSFAPSENVSYSGAEPLVVGTTAQNPPFTFLHEGAYVGFDIELVTLFAASVGRLVSFHIMNFGSLIPSLVSGKINMIASMVMITEERKNQVDFSDPYYYIGSSVLVRRANLAHKTNK